MLTGYQATTVAFITEDSEIICESCAHDRYGADVCERNRMGLFANVELHSLCRYTLDEMDSERAYDDSENYPEDDYDSWPKQGCDSCGNELDY